MGVGWGEGEVKKTPKNPATNKHKNKSIISTKLIVIYNLSLRLSVSVT